jgi:hypothetical protein
VCYRAEEPIHIDGRLDEPSWRQAPWTEEFVDIEGDVKPRPRFRTRAKMLWDDRYFYVAARLDEPHVWGTLTRHDAVIYQDNDFEVFIDPDGDNHQYYELEINALNTEWDLLLSKPYKDQGEARNEWEVPGLKTAVHVEGTLNDPADTDQAWSVELAIPWAVLAEFAHRKSPPADGDQWRVNFSRVEWRHELKAGRYQKVPKLREDNWVWSPQAAIDMHRPERWGYVQFATGPIGQGVFRPDPTASARDILHRIYYAQKDFFKAHGRWAATLKELGLGDDLGRAANSNPPSLRLTRDGYQATIEVRRSNGQVVPLHIRQDSLVWQGSGPPDRSG